MIVAAIVLAVLVVLLVALLYLAVTAGTVEWSSNENLMSHYFIGSNGRGVTVENIPCRNIEFVFGRICIDISIGRWT